MAEAKNTFIKSRMNRDLDARLIPNGEYREAFNVTISKSEGEGVGSLENILGNLYKTDFSFNDSSSGDGYQPMTCIGHCVDESKNRVVVFLTSFTDASADILSNDLRTPGVLQPTIASAIAVFNAVDGTYNILTQGNYLNFSDTHKIIGTNIIEDLLFWTDNRNQPRKLNIQTALANPNYYNNEDHVSVAKYYPYNPICLLELRPNNGNPGNEFQGSLNYSLYNSGMKDVTSEYLPIHTSAQISTVPSASSIVVSGEHFNIQPEQATNLRDGDLITSARIDSKVTVDNVNVGTGTTTFTFHSDAGLNSTALFGSTATKDIIYFQRQNPLYNVNWPGDSQYAKRKYIRFSYRFKFDDGEYSLMAPFTQIGFVPEQDGYFIGDLAVNNIDDGTIEVKAAGTQGQESKTFETTIVDFMQNKINDYNLYIPAPAKFETSGSLMNFSQLNDLLKITEIDILIKTSDSGNVMVVDTLKTEDFSGIVEQYYNYNYQSKKPWRVLPEDEITRVSDAVPIKAFAQEVAGNRVIYGNFVDKHSSPINLDYTIAVSDKFPLPTWNGVGTQPSTYTDKDYYIRKEYQNHTLKQNRTYQVGVVLSDRYGRSSNVILSKQKSNTNATAKGDTIYHRYKSVEQNLITDNTYGSSSRDTWPGDALQATFYSPIPEAKDLNGYPGAFTLADGSIVAILNIIDNQDFGSVQSFTNIAVVPVAQASVGSGCTIDFSTILDPAGSGKYIINVSSIAIATQGTGYLFGESVQFTAGGVTVAATTRVSSQNELGFFSYKIVVKQQEQEYYNAYLPGALAGYPAEQTGVDPSATSLPIPEFKYPVGQERFTSHVVLINDNINKIPRDLNEVGPDQLKFRSSATLYPRVKNILTNPTGSTWNFSSTQVDPNTTFDTAVEIGTMQDLELGDTIINSANKTVPLQFYLGQNNPLIARIEVEKQFGVSSSQLSTAFSTAVDQGPTLSIFETKPVESNLELFYETTTSGLINDLNNNIKFNDNTIPVGINLNEISWSEADDFGTGITSDFRAIGVNGAFLDGITTLELTGVTRGGSAINNVSDLFNVTNVSSGVINISLASFNAVTNPGWIFDANPVLNNFVFSFLATRTTDGVQININVPGTLYNRAPNEYFDTNPPATNERTRDELISGIFNKTLSISSSNGLPIADGSYLWNPTYGTSGPNYGIQAFGSLGIYKSETSSVDGGSTSNSTQLYTSLINTSQAVTPYGFNFPAVYNEFQSNQGTQNWGPVISSTYSFNQATPNPANPATGLFYLNASNGMYGSYASNPPFNPIEVTPTGWSNRVGNQVVWSIPRMYQVSTYVPRRYFTDQNPSAGGLAATYELVFGSDPAVSAELGLPNNPIYFANDSSQLLASAGGEPTVGSLYNQGVHYWPDIEDFITYANTPADATNVQTLVQGYNTFYDGCLSAKQGDNSTDVENNLGGFIRYLGGIDTDPNSPYYKLGPGSNPNDAGFSDMLFSVVEDPNNSNTGSSKAYLQIGPNGNTNYASGSAFGGGKPYLYSQGQGGQIYGLTVPGGRYVITVRATDANGGGQYFEWDLPVMITPWAVNIGDITQTYGLPGWI